jgi:hypothetical protein
MKRMKFRLIGAAFALTSAFALGTADADKPGGGGGGNPNCPQQPYNGVCIQVITWAKNPVTGECCQYPNPCVVPAGWQTYNSPDCTNVVFPIE